MAKLSQFEKWFKAQFGSLPIDHRSSVEIMESISGLKQELFELELELQECQEIKRRFDAALKTRYAAQKGFKF